MRLFNGDKHLSFRLTTISDAPVGSGLGSSSTMIVAMIKAYSEWLKIPLSDYEVANLAYEIERIDLCLSGGKQDQYAASFGGLNFIQFYKDGKVLVNPLKIKESVKFELESQLILYFTGKSRESAKIIDQQVKNTKANNVALDSMHKVKEYAYEMKRAILLGDFDLLYQCINNGWKEKKKMADSISNQKIDETYDFVMNNGGFAARISGAGGGGFMLILCDPVRRSKLIEKLREKEGKVLITSLTEVGATAWTI